MTVFIYFSILLQKARDAFGNVFVKKAGRFAWAGTGAWTFPGVDLLPPAGMFFAAEDEGRTEEPTERRKQKEREKGRVAKSQEIPGALVTLGGITTLFLSAGWVIHRIFTLMENYIGNFHRMPGINESSVMPLIYTFIRETAIILLPVFTAAVIMGIAGNLVQTGFMFTLKPLQPDFSRMKLDFPTLARKIFFSRQIVVNLVKTLLKVSFMGVIAYWIIYSDFLLVMKTSTLGVGESLKVLGMIAFKLAIILTGLLLLISIPDYFFQRFEFMESLKMTKQQVKEEFKETEGDPLVKQRQRQAAMDIMKRSMLGKVKEADVVITNPTHYAVALRYDDRQEEAPRVVAKGEDEIALAIRRLAKSLGKPLIENKPLARRLYAEVELNEVIPVELYQVLAEIYKQLDTFKDKVAS